METIAKHHKNLTKRFLLRGESAEEISSAKELARLILASNRLTLPHKKKMLNEVVWLVSLLNHKYSTRFRSRDVVDKASRQNPPKEAIQHEHVIPKKEIVRKMLDEPRHAASMLDLVVSCVVTRTEHKKLKGSDGWQRYLDANIEVYDMSKRVPKLLNLRAEIKKNDWR